MLRSEGPIKVGRILLECRPGLRAGGSPGLSALPGPNACLAGPRPDLGRDSTRAADPRQTAHRLAPGWSTSHSTVAADAGQERFTGTGRQRVRCEARPAGRTWSRTDADLQCLAAPLYSRNTRLASAWLNAPTGGTARGNDAPGRSGVPADAARGTRKGSVVPPCDRRWWQSCGPDPSSYPCLG